MKTKNKRIRISERDLILFKTLSEPLLQIGLTVSEITDWFFHYGCNNTSYESAISSIYRRIKQLDRNEILLKYSIPTESEKLYCLNKEYEYLYGNIHSPIRNSPVKLQPVFLAHERLATKFSLDFIVKMKSIDSDYKYTSITHSPIELRVKDLVPDGVLKSKIKDELFLFMIEVDNTTEGFEVYQSKLARYLKFFTLDNIDYKKFKVLFLAASNTRKKCLKKYFSQFLELVVNEINTSQEILDILKSTIRIASISDLELCILKNWENMNGEPKELLCLP